MSLKGTPYYGMALDAGAAKGDEAEQMAQMIQQDHIRQMREDIEERARLRQLEQEQERIANESSVASSDES